MSPAAATENGKYVTDEIHLYIYGPQDSGPILRFRHLQLWLHRLSKSSRFDRNPERASGGLSRCSVPRRTSETLASPPFRAAHDRHRPLSRAAAVWESANGTAPPRRRPRSSVQRRTTLQKGPGDGGPVPRWKICRSWKERLMVRRRPKALWLTAG